MNSVEPTKSIHQHCHCEEIIAVKYICLYTHIFSNIGDKIKSIHFNGMVLNFWIDNEKHEMCALSIQINKINNK